MKDDKVRINIRDDEVLLDLLGDVYDKMKIQNEIVLKLIEYLRDNGYLTDGQVRHLLDITLDQISDPAEREKEKRILHDDRTTNDDRRMDPELCKLEESSENGVCNFGKGSKSQNRFSTDRDGKQPPGGAGSDQSRLCERDQS